MKKMKKMIKIAAITANCAKIISENFVKKILNHTKNSICSVGSFLLPHCRSIKTDSK